MEIVAATEADAPAIADIHLTSRRDAMPYLRRVHTDEQTRAWFAAIVGDRAGSWWLARQDGQVAGYMRLIGDELDQLYVRPGWQRRGVGSLLLAKAKRLSPRRLTLWTFQRNDAARKFYARHGFRAAGFTDGRNEENEPDVRYVWP